jgi:hypothetical protein
MNEEMLKMLSDPSQHAALAEKLAMMGAPPKELPSSQSAPQLGELLAQNGQVPTGPMPAPKPAPGVQWWKPPSDPRPPMPAPAPTVPSAPPSAGFNPNQDRQWRDDVQFLTDEQFMQKWGTPKPGGM